MNGRTDEWYTPPYLIDALGEFDLDPCAAPDRTLHFAKQNFTKEDDGLNCEWGGRVFLNPPYSHPLVDKFVNKMVNHKRGIMLTFTRLDTQMFQDLVLPNATAIMFLRGRIKFSNAKHGGNCGSMLTAFSEDDAEALRKSKLDGFFIKLNNTNFKN